MVVTSFLLSQQTPESALAINSRLGNLPEGQAAALLDGRGWFFALSGGVFCRSSGPGQAQDDEFDSGDTPSSEWARDVAGCELVNTAAMAWISQGHLIVRRLPSAFSPAKPLGIMKACPSTDAWRFQMKLRSRLPAAPPTAINGIVVKTSGNFYMFGPTSLGGVGLFTWPCVSAPDVASCPLLAEAVTLSTSRYVVLDVEYLNDGSRAALIFRRSLAADDGMVFVGMSELGRVYLQESELPSSIGPAVLALSNYALPAGHACGGLGAQ